MFFISFEVTQMLSTRQHSKVLSRVTETSDELLLAGWGKKKLITCCSSCMLRVGVDEQRSNSFRNVRTTHSATERKAAVIAHLHDPDFPSGRWQRKHARGLSGT